MWIEIQTHTGPAVIGVVYRHPDNRHDYITQFSTKLHDTRTFYELNSKKCPVYALGDYSINFNQNKFRQLSGCT